MRDVLTARPVTALAADIPFGDLLGVNVVVHRMAAIARRAGGALHVVRRIERFPPVSSRRYKIRTPYTMSNVPLRRLGKIIVANFGEVPLFPNAAVNQSNLGLSKLAERI